ncbi:MAG: hypothetical protein JWO36_1267 [Myxococcales bacterium]|nr:hypothetical protein [Myxococcales bacterium]
MASSMLDSKPALSRHPPPGIPRHHRHIWAVALVVWLAGLGVFEVVVRRHGFKVSREEPSAVSIRRAVDEIQPNDLVLIGASEIMSAVDREMLSAALHRRVRLLVVYGAIANPLFEYLLQRRPDFRGQVILTLTVTNFTNRAKVHEAKLRTVLESASKVTPSQTISEAITDWLADRFVFRNQQLDLHAEFLGEMHVKIENLAVTPTGERVAALKSPEELRYHQAGWDHVNFTLDSEANNVRGATVGRAFSELRARGGGGLLVYFPSIGGKQAVEDRFPRQSAWNRLAADSGVPALRLDDDPELMAVYKPQDGIHLDVETRRPFTRVFAKVLERYGFAAGKDR